jgi:hypothetical protein
VVNLLFLSSEIAFASKVFVEQVAKRYNVSRLVYANREVLVLAVYFLGR